MQIAGVEELISDVLHWSKHKLCDNPKAGWLVYFCKALSHMQSLEETYKCSGPLRSVIRREKRAMVRSPMPISPSHLGKISVVWLNLSSSTRKLFRKFCFQTLLLHYYSFIISSGCASRKSLYGNWLLRTNPHESQRIVWQVWCPVCWASSVVGKAFDPVHPGRWLLQHVPLPEKWQG